MLRVSVGKNSNAHFKFGCTVSLLEKIAVKYYFKHALETCFKKWVTSCWQRWDSWRLQRTQPAEGSFQRVQSAEAIFGNRPECLPACLKYWKLRRRSVKMNSHRRLWEFQLAKISFAHFKFGGTTCTVSLLFGNHLTYLSKCFKYWNLRRHSVRMNSHRRWWWSFSWQR